MIKAVVSIIVLLGLGLYSLPYIIRDQAVIWLRQHGAEQATLQGIKVNWWQGQVSLQNLVARAPQRPPLVIGQLQVEIDYAALFNQRLLIENLRLQDVQGGLQQQGEQLWLGPVDLNPLSSDAPAEADSTPSQWHAGIAKAQLTDIDWRVDLPQQQQHWQIEQARLTSLMPWKAEEPTDFSLTGRLNDAPLTITSESQLLSSDKTARLHLVLEQFPLQSVVRYWQPQLQGQLSADLHLSLALQGLDGQIEHQGTLTLAQLDWQQGDLQLADPLLNWSGQGRLALVEGAPQTVTLEGELNSQQLRLKQGEQLALALQQLRWNSATELTFAAEGIRQVSGPQTINLQALTLQQPALKVQAQQLRQQGPLKLDFDQGAPANLSTSLQLQLSQLALQQADLKVGVADLGLQAPLTLNLTGGTPTRLNTQVDLDLSGLALQQPALQLDSERIQLKSPLTLTWQNTQLARLSARPQLNLAASALDYQQAVTVNLATGELQATLDDMALNNPQIKQVQAQFSQLRSRASKNELDLLLADSLTVTDLAYQPDRLNVAKVAGQGIIANRQGDNSMLVLKTLMLDELVLADTRDLHIASLTLQDSESRFLINQDQNVTELVRLEQALAGLSDTGATLPSPDTAASKAKATEAASKNAGATVSSDPSDDLSGDFTVRIDRLTLTGNHRIDLTDRSVQPTFSSQVDISKLTASQLSTEANQRSPFALTATINRHAKLNASGEIDLLGGARNGHWQVALKNVELPVISPYSGKYIGYYLRSGQLDFNSKGTLDKGKLDGENRIVLNRLQVQSAQSSATQSFNQALSMPLSTAIAVLENDNDNIILDVPVEGSLDDPQFGYQGIINRLATKGLKKAALGFLTKSLQPYAALLTLANTAINANETGAFITLNPIGFAAGTTEPDAQANDYLGKIAQMMQEREGLRLNICGNAVSADRQALLPALQEENEARDEPLTPAQLEVQMLERLQALAVARGDWVLDQLLGLGLDKARLFSCFPVPNLKDNRLQPGVALGL